MEGNCLGPESSLSMNVEIIGYPVGTRSRWTTSKGGPYVLAPLAEDYEPDTVWVAAYKVELNGTTVISA